MRRWLVIALVVAGIPSVAVNGQVVSAVGIKPTVSVGWGNQDGTTPVIAGYGLEVDAQLAAWMLALTYDKSGPVRECLTNTPPRCNVDVVEADLIAARVSRELVSGRLGAVYVGIGGGLARWLNNDETDHLNESLFGVSGEYRIPAGPLFVSIGGRGEWTRSMDMYRLVVGVGAVPWRR